MARTEAMKQAQRRYRLKIQNDTGAVGTEYKAKEAKRHRARYYTHKRNYTDKGNWAISFKWLYA
jgi:hypothetical protein